MVIKRILVIKYGAIGDFIAGTIMLMALRKAFPTAHLTLLSKASNQVIVPPGSIIDEFWQVEEVKTGKLGYWKLLRQIRQGHFDLIINLRWNSEVLAVITSLSGATYRAGISRTWTKHLYNYTVDDLGDFDNRHEYLKNSDPLRALGIDPGFPEAYVHVSQADADKAAKILSTIHQPFIILCPTASTPLKAWPPERYIALGRWVWEKHRVPLVISWAGAIEHEVATRVAVGIGAGTLLLPAVSINVLAAIMRQSALCICNNSGALHIAFSQKIPVICFNTSKGWEPYGPDNVSLSVFSDRLGFNLVYTTNEMAAEQLATISVESAIDTFEQKWQSIHE